MQPEDDPKSAAKKERYKYSTDQLMNQFLKTEGGGLGRSPEFRRGYVWNFEWCGDPPMRRGKPELVKKVNDLMAAGKTFEEAFDEVAYYEQIHRGP